MKKTLMMATLALSTVGFAGGASATTLLFSYAEAGGIDFTFEQSSTPTPLSYSLNDYTLVPVSDWTGNIGTASSIYWYSLGDLGQFDTTTSTVYVVYGPQIYTGLESAPVFATGTFAGADQINGLSGTLTVTAVPEPATWAMTMIGFAGLGFAGYRMSRRNGAAVVA